MLVGYEMIIANEARSTELAITISYPTRTCGKIIIQSTFALLYGQQLNLQRK